MNAIWANRLIAGTKTWAQVPDNRKETVKAILRQRVADEVLSADEYQRITGEAYPVTE